MEALLARIDEVNPTVNALRVVLHDEALAAADAADRALAAGEPVGPLHGVPFTVKENLDVAGTATTGGVAAMVDALATRDAPAVAGLRAAGAIPIGRSNLAELGFRWHTYSGAGGDTVNPWDAGRTPGGSSGGEAVALATGMTPLGVGNDLGGSLRIPSQLNGTAALKPTFGRIASAASVPPLDPILAIQVMAVEGPMARRVEDLRAALGPMTRPDPRDPWHAPGALHAPEVPRRVAVALWDGLDADVAAAVRLAADALEAAGYELEEAQPPRQDEAREAWASVVVSEFRAVWPLIGPFASQQASRFVELAFEVVPPLAPEAHGAAYVTRREIAREWAEWMQDTPLVLAPGFAGQAFEVGYDLTDADAVRDVLDRQRAVVPANFLGLPAAAVPAGETNGLPQGVQVIGPRWREDLCLDAAEAIERAVGTLAPIDPR